MQRSNMQHHMHPDNDDSRHPYTTDFHTNTQVPERRDRYRSYAQTEPERRSQETPKAPSTSSTRSGILKPSPAVATAAESIPTRSAEPPSQQNPVSTKPPTLNNDEQRLWEAAELHANQQLTTFKVHLSAYGNTLLPVVP
eukprot:m.32457 g.32457  ORF g.32457 m.32457 type:complete len:140 (+) comp12152_c0_seq5:60-479(+)